MKKKTTSVPTNRTLYNRIKQEVKKDFDVWPSAYASGSLVKRYKAAGGKYKSISKKKASKR